MPKAIVVRETGSSDVLQLVNIPAPKILKAGQVLVRQTAIGINFMDIYYRKGIYKTRKLPMVPGMEACGVVEAAGKGVNIPIGSRVIYATAKTGAYCELRTIHEKHLVGIPDSIPDNVAVALFAKALTAHYLLFRTYVIKPGDKILVHAAAGGVGQILCQWAKYMGAIIIGTVGSDEKIQIARNNGCDHVINYSNEDFAKRVKEITNGTGVNVVYDSVGKDTFNKSLDSLQQFGLMVSYGQSSGNIPTLDVLQLATKGLYLTRPTLMLYKGDRKELILSAVEVFTAFEQGVIKPTIAKQYNLSEIAQAHDDIESRKTIGSSIVVI